MNDVRNFSINKKSNSLLKFLIGAVIFLFLLFVLNLFVSPIKNVFYTISAPIQKTFWLAGESSSNYLSSVFRAGSMAKENDNLKNENQNLLSEIASLQSIEQGSQAQKDVLAACQNSGLKTIIVGVNGLNDDNLSINKGSADGIIQGMPVINQQGVLFGKVFKVYKNFSQVMLVTNKNSVVNVKIQAASVLGSGDQSSEIDGVVKGSGGLNAYLDLIPIDSDINPQDVLVTSAIDKTFPKDLLVGKITNVEKNDQKPFQQAKISLFLNVKTADNLFVITNYKQAS